MRDFCMVGRCRKFLIVTWEGVELMFSGFRG